MLALDRVGKTYPAGLRALDGVTLSVSGGEILAVVGGSGCGKSTLLRIISGLDRPTSGTVALDGAAVTAPHPKIGMVFQEPRLLPWLTVADNVGFGLNGLAKAVRERRVAAQLDRVGLYEKAGAWPRELSGGQAQRVALARALVNRPEVLLLDEPFSALDKNLRGQMQEEMRRLHRETGTTFVFVTHDQSEALALSTRIAIFEKGRLQQLAAPREVYERPANRFVAEFLGEINILPLAGVSSDGQGGGGQFEGQALRAVAADRPGAASLAVRPEYMKLHLSRPETGNAVAARLDHTTYLGAETRLALRTPGGADLTLLLPTAELPAGLESGTPVWAGWSETRGFLL